MKKEKELTYEQEQERFYQFYKSVEEIIEEC